MNAGGGESRTERVLKGTTALERHGWCAGFQVKAAGIAIARRRWDGSAPTLDRCVGRLTRDQWIRQVFKAGGQHAW